MASRLPWFPFYPDDYLHDTYDLSACEHGVYLLLLSRFWVSGPLRDNLDALCRVAAGASPQMVREILERFWELTGQGWVNKRMQIEMDKSIRVSERAIKANQVRWEKKSTKTMEAPIQMDSRIYPHGVQEAHNHPSPEIRQKKNITKTTEQPIQMDSNPHPHTHKENTCRATTAKPVNGWSDVAAVLDLLNDKAGSSFDLRNNTGKYTANAELIRQRIDEHGVDACKAVVVAKCAEWQGDDKMAAFRRPGTLFAKRNFENYKGALGQSRQANQFPPAKTYKTAEEALA